MSFEVFKLFLPQDWSFICFAAAPVRKSSARRGPDSGHKKNANQRDLNVTNHGDNSADTSETKQARIERDMYRRDLLIARLSDNPVIFKP